MNCPACLTYGLTTEATVQVDGTQLCAPHGVEAFSQMRTPGDGRRGGSRPVVFTPPPTASQQ